MGRIIWGTLVAGAAALGLGAIEPGAAQADPYHGYGGGYGYGYGGAFGSYYGRGGHDVVPHWHTTTTPFGQFNWYGRGNHDYRPHWHSYGPYHYEGISRTPFGYTRSYYPRYPYTYAPW